MSKFLLIACSTLALANIATAQQAQLPDPKVINPGEPIIRPFSPAEEKKWRDLYRGFEKDHIESARAYAKDALDSYDKQSGNKLPENLRKEFDSLLNKKSEFYGVKLEDVFKVIALVKPQKNGQYLNPTQIGQIASSSSPHDTLIQIDKSMGTEPDAERYMGEIRGFTGGGVFERRVTPNIYQGNSGPTLESPRGSGGAF